MDAAIRGPIVIGGTKWPSMTSTWITRAPAAITSSTCAPNRENSAERMDGGTGRSPKRTRGGIACLHGAEHRIAAVLAAQVLVGAHPGDRLMLATVGALRDQLITSQGVDAAVAARQLRRAKPRLAATGAGRALERGVLGLH